MPSRLAQKVDIRLGSEQSMVTPDQRFAINSPLELHRTPTDLSTAQSDPWVDDVMADGDVVEFRFNV
jgi:hypothetical protein